MKNNKKFDMMAFLDYYSIANNPYSSISTSEYTALDCPYCGGHETLGAHLTSGFFSCWKGCTGAKDFWSTLAILSGESDVKPILKKFGGYISMREQSYVPSENVRPTTIDVPGTADITPKHKAYTYIRDVRGFDPELLFQREGLTFTTHGEDIYSYRIIFPVRDRKGRVCSYQGRDYTQDPDRVRFAACKGEREIVNHQHLIYNQHNCPGDNILVTEGIFDTLRIGNHASSTFGISFTTEQANLLRKYYKNVFILFDSEERAQEQADKLGYLIASGSTNVEVISIDNTEGQDADEIFRDKEDDLIYLKKELKLY